LLVDDLPEMRERVTGSLRDEFDIVGPAHNGQQAIKAAAAPELLESRLAEPASR
jgi:CheY-like chemotaxis protein